MLKVKPEAGQTAKRKLPIGIQTFRKIREDLSYYVDKTAYIRRLVAEGTHYFLSRPAPLWQEPVSRYPEGTVRGQRAAVSGADHPRPMDWSVRHPVLRLSFGSGNFKEPGFLHENLMDQLTAIERRAGVVAESATAPGRFARLLEALHDEVGQPVAVLVDEYDKPILDALEEPEIARANRDYLRGLYATIKDSDAHIRVYFPHRVSKFSKVSLFSGLNNLIDITLDPHYSAICGYTEADLDAVFAPELSGLDRDAIRAWYNGYNWLGDEQVYNPFDVLLLFRRRTFAAYWFETGTPTFLLDTLLARGISALALDDMPSSEELLSTFDVDHIATEALLFQTGYLTIRRTESRGGEIYYRLGYPNREVQQSLNKSLLNHLTGNPARQVEHNARLYDLLLGNDFDGWKRCSRHSLPAFPTSGIRIMRLPATKATMPACSTRTSRRWGWILRWRTVAVKVVSTWRGVQRERVSVRVQGSGTGGGRSGAAAVAGAGLRGQVSQSRRADLPDRSGV